VRCFEIVFAVVHTKDDLKRYTKFVNSTVVVTMIYVIISRPGQDNFVYRYPPIGGTIKTLAALAEESLTHVDIC